MTMAIDDYRAWNCQRGHVTMAMTKPSACSMPGCKAPITGERVRG